MPLFNDSFDNPRVTHRYSLLNVTIAPGELHLDKQLGFLPLPPVESGLVTLPWVTQKHALTKHFLCLFHNKLSYFPSPHVNCGFLFLPKAAGSLPSHLPLHSSIRGSSAS